MTDERRLHSRRVVDSELCRLHGEQLDLLNGRITRIEKNTLLLVDRQKEIRDLLEERRDWQGAKSYGKFIVWIVGGLAAFAGSTLGIVRYVWPR
jgi:hypothetical protein